MDEMNKSTKDAGEEVIEQIGALREVTKELSDEKDCGVKPAEVSSWIEAIGKALLAIFK